MALLAVAIKAALLLALAWLGAALLRRGTAAARHALWTLGVAGALVLPLLCAVLPSLVSVAPPAAHGDHTLVGPAVLITGGAAAISAPTRFAWPTWLALAWAAGALVVALRFLRGHLAARRLARGASPAHADAWSSALRDAATSLGVTRSISLRRSDAIASPMIAGLLRPCVLLPAAADGWSPARLRAVLLHELGHVRRRDTLVQLAAQLVCALYWWNPLAWLAAARLRIEREHACDDLVLAAGVRPSSYAADLLDVARALAPAHAGAVYMVEPSSTEARLRRVLDGAAPRRPLRARFRLAATAVALGCAVTLACTSTEPTPSAAAATAPPALLGTLAIGAPFVTADPDPNQFPPPAWTAASYDLSLVASEVQRHVGELQRCYDRRLRAQPQLSGTILMHWVITEDGKVADQCITEDSVHDAELNGCVNELVKAGHFPTHHGGAVDVSFPFVFTARG